MRGMDNFVNSMCIWTIGLLMTLHRPAITISEVRDIQEQANDILGLGLGWALDTAR